MLHPGGATKYDARKPLVDSAAAAGVKLFFASEFASNVMSPHFAKFPPLFIGDKIRARGYLEKKVGRGGGLRGRRRTEGRFLTCVSFAAFSLFISFAWSGLGWLVGVVRIAS